MENADFVCLTLSAIVVDMGVLIMKEKNNNK